MPLIRIALTFCTIAAVWLALAAAAMLPGTIATAFVPATTAIPQGIAVVDRRGPLLIVQSENPRYVRDLYANGAAFVLPARKKTCLELQR